jgi:hypothetical protein
MNGDLGEFDSKELPRIVGVLTLCGWDREDATAYARKGATSAMRGGFVGGTDAARTIEEMLLLDAKPPHRARPPDGPLEAALANLPWEERIATVVTVVPGIRRLGPGKPEAVAGALGGEPIEQAIAKAVAARAGSTDGHLMEEAEASYGRQRKVLLGVAVAIVLILIVLLGVVIAAL